MLSMSSVAGHGDAVQNPAPRSGVPLRSNEFKLKSGINRILPTGYPHLFRFKLELAPAPR